MRLPWVLKGEAWLIDASLRMGEVERRLWLKRPGSWYLSPILLLMKRVKELLAL